MDLTRILGLVVCIAILVAYYGWRWRRAGDYVANMEAFKSAGQSNFLSLKQHPKTQELLARIAERHRASFEPATDPMAYQIVWLALLDERATCYRVADIDRATMLVGYLYREANDPKQLMITLMLRTGELHEQVPPYGWSLPAPSLA